MPQQQQEDEFDTALRALRAAPQADDPFDTALRELRPPLLEAKPIRVTQPPRPVARAPRGQAVRTALQPVPSDMTRATPTSVASAEEQRADEARQERLANLSPRTRALGYGLGVGKGILGMVEFPVQVARAVTQDLGPESTPPAARAGMSAEARAAEDRVLATVRGATPGGSRTVEAVNPLPLLEHLAQGVLERDPEVLGELASLAAPAVAGFTRRGARRSPAPPTEEAVQLADAKARYAAEEQARTAQKARETLTPAAGTESRGFEVTGRRAMPPVPKDPARSFTPEPLRARTVRQSEPGPLPPAAGEIAPQAPTAPQPDPFAGLVPEAGAAVTRPKRPPHPMDVRNAGAEVFGEALQAFRGMFYDQGRDAPARVFRMTRLLEQGKSLDEAIAEVGLTKPEGADAALHRVRVLDVGLREAQRAAGIPPWEEVLAEREAAKRAAGAPHNEAAIQKVGEIPPGSSLEEVQASKEFNRRLRTHRSARRELEERFADSAEYEGEGGLPSTLVAALKQVDDLGFDTPEHAAAAIIQNADWRTRWDVSRPEDAGVRDVIGRWKAQVLGYAPEALPGPVSRPQLEAGAPHNPAAIQEGLFGDKTLTGKEQTEMLPETAGVPTARLGESKISTPEDIARVRREGAEPTGAVPGELPFTPEADAQLARHAELTAMIARDQQISGHTTTQYVSQPEISQFQTGERRPGAQEAEQPRVFTRTKGEGYPALGRLRQAERRLKLMEATMPPELLAEARRRAEGTASTAAEAANLRLNPEEGAADLAAERAAIADEGEPLAVGAGDFQRVLEDRPDRAGSVPLHAVRDFLRRNFTSVGDLPPKAFAANVGRVGRINSAMRQTVYTMRLFRKALREAGWSAPTERQMALVDDALKGGTPVDLPVPLRAIAARMRREMDVFSRRLIDEGVIDGPLVAKVEGNLGMYATRSYRVFDDPGWAKQVPADVRNKFKALLRAEHPNMPPAELDGLFDSFLYRGEDGPIAVLKKSALGSKDLSLLTKRKDLAPELRALWGEYRDPRVNYARSVVKMAHLLENHRFLTEVMQGGKGGFFFERPTVGDGVSYHTQFAAEGSKVLEPLNGLYTSPEIAEAFRQLDDVTKDPTWLKLYYQANGAAKYAKTVGSVVTHVRNLLSNVGFAVANGHWRVLKAGSAIRATMANLLTNNPKWQAYYRHLVERGVVHESVSVGELRDAMRDANLVRDADASVGRQAGTSLVRRAQGAGRAVLRGAESLYRAEDEVWKVYAYENELARYKKAFPSLHPDIVEAKAAEIVRNTWPTYSMVPRGVKLLRRSPFIGPFVSFSAEVVRTLANTIELTQAELRNPATRGIGAQRLAGLTVAAVSVPAMTAASRWLNGMSKDDEEDVRQVAPPWSENGSLLVTQRDATAVKYIDASYTDAYAVLRRPLIALMRNEPWEQALADAATEAVKPFFGEELLAGKLLDLARNRTATGRQVYNPADDPMRQVTDAVAHVASVVTPGTVESAKRIIKGVRGEVSASGRAFDPRTELVATLTGQRVATMDLQQALRTKAFQFSGDIDSARKLFLAVALRSGAVSEDEILDAYERAERARQDAYQTYSRVVLATRRLGLSTHAARMAMSKAGVTLHDIGLLEHAGYRPYVPGNEILKRMPRDRFAPLRKAIRAGVSP